MTKLFIFQMPAKVVVDVSQERPPCLETRASCCSSLFFNWVGPSVRVARGKILEESDLNEIAEKDKSLRFQKEFARRWDEKTKEFNDGKAKDKPTLQSIIIPMFRRPFFVAAGFKLFHDCLAYLTPVLLNWIIKYIEDGEQKYVGEMPYGYVLAIAMATSQFLQSIFLNQYFHIMYRMGMNVKTTVICGGYSTVCIPAPSLILFVCFFCLLLRIFFSSLSLLRVSISLIFCCCF